MPTAGEKTVPAPRGQIAVVTILLMVILAAGILFYESQEERIKSQVTRDLTSIAVLKSDQISSWREDRLYDARVISSSDFFIEGVDHYLTYGDNDSRDKILNWFREMNISPLYNNIVLLDPEGDVRLSLDPAATTLPRPVLTRAAASLENGDAVLTDLFRVPGTNTIRMGVIAPLMTKEDGSEKPVGVVLLSINPDDFLYPLIQSWPVPSESAETLLIEREGDHVLFLNELRHQNDTALNLTIPISRSDVPAVMAVAGVTGTFEGRDYRDVNVVSVLKPIEGSPWYMVTKVDSAEAYSSWSSRSVLIVTLVCGTLAGALVILGLLWQRRQKYYYRELYAAEAERGREEQRNRERLETLLRLSEMTESSGQELADFVLDAACRLTASPLAFIGTMTRDESVFDITAWSKSVMKDCAIAASPIHYPIDEAGIWAEAVRQRTPIIMNDYTAPQPGKNGLPAGHAPITRFVSVPVFERQRIVMVCAVANKEMDYTALDVDNLTFLMQGVWNHFRKREADEALRQKSADLEAAYEELTATDEELAANYEVLARNQQALKASEQRLRRFYDSGLFGVIFWNMDGKITDANDKFLSMTGYTREDLVSGILDWSAMTPHEFRYLDERSTDELRTSGINSIPYEKEYYRKDGSRLPILIAGAMIDERRSECVAFVLDRSELKKAEAGLAAEQQRYRELFDNVHIGILRTTPGPQGAIIDANPAVLRIFEAESREQFLAMHPDNLYYYPDERRDVGDAIMARGFVDGMEIRFRTLRGRAIWGRTTAIRKTAGDGSIYFDNTIEDITDRKKAEAEREEYSRQRQLALNAARLGWWHYNPVTHIASYDERYREIFGVTGSERPNEEILTLLHPDDLPRVWAAVEAALDPSDPKSYDVEYRVNAADGVMRWVRATGIAAFEGSGSQRRAVSFVGTVEDVTERKRIEESLRESEESYRVLAANLPGIVYRLYLQEDNNMVFFNDQLKELSGYTAEELRKGKICSIEPLIHPEDRQAVCAAVHKAIEEASAFTVEYRFLHKDGTVRYFVERGKIVCGRDKKPRFIDGVIHDITAARMAEEEIRSAKTFLDMVIDMSPFPMWISDNKGIVTRVNRSLCETIRLAPEDIVGKYNVLMDMNLENEGVMPSVKAVFENQVPARFSIPWKASDAGNVDFSGARDMYIDVSLFPILNTRGELTHAVCQWVDITERKSAEEAVRETNEYLQNLLDYANAPILVWDPQFRITRFNHAFEDLTGMTEQEVMGRHLAILFPEASRDTSLELIRKTLAGERWEIVEIPILNSSGETRIVLWNSANIVDPNGTIVSTIAQGQDITDRKITEVQRELLIKELELKNTELERFTYTVSHDLKSPLITIKGFAGLLENDARKGDHLQLKKDINRITEAAEIMQALLADLLELSRVGKIVNPPERTGFDAIAREALDLLAGPLAERGISVEIAPDLPEVVVDHARIREVMVNLIENAIKFVDDRPDPLIRIGMDSDGDIPVFFVQDNGIGIDPRYLERIFNLFEKLDPSRPGTGIGLTLVRRIIEVHGGKIWAESDGPGKGTTFRFTLPLNLSFITDKDNNR